MNLESLEEFTGGLLGVESPWEVEEIIRDSKAREVRVIVAYIEGETPPCPTCGKSSPIHDRKTRKWRHLDSCNHKTIIESDIPRVKCEEHGVLQVPVPWAERNSRFTQELERHVCMWLLEASISAVASMFNLSWDAVAGIQERAVNRGLAKRETVSPKNIGIDETSFQKRHEYVSVILDKDNNTVLDVLQDRKAETLDGWFKTQKVADFKALGSISMDMWDAFIKAVKANFEGAESLIAFDRYHVAQHLNKAVDKVRAQEHRELMRENGTSELTGTKYAPRGINTKTATQLLHRSEEEGKNYLNGYPLISHGYQLTRQLYSGLQKPVSLRHGTPDARLLAEVAMASGIAEIEGGAICYCLPYSEGFPIDRSLLYWQYVDRVCAANSTKDRPSIAKASAL